MGMIETSQAEMDTIVAERKLRASLNRNVPPASYRIYKLQEPVLVYNQNNKRWEGP